MRAGFQEGYRIIAKRLGEYATDEVASLALLSVHDSLYTVISSSELLMA